MTRTPLADDAALVRLCRRGDTKAFELLVARHTRFAGAVAVSVVGDYHAAMDVVQEAFVKVLAGIGQLQEPERFKGWLRGVVRRAAIDHLRRRSVTGRSAAALPGQDSDSAPLPSESPAPEDVLAREELREDIRAEISLLPDSQREVVMLKYLDERSYDEIAATLGVTVATVESRLFRARTTLRQRLVRRLDPSERRRD